MPGSAPVSQQAFHLASQIGRMYAFEWNPSTDSVVRTGDAGLLGELWGASRDTGNHFLSRVHPEDREKFNFIACGVTPRRPSYDLSYRYIHDNGAVIWLHERGSAFFDHEDQLQRVIGITADITRSKEAEEALRQLGGRLLSAQEEERTRIARELHDDIGQDLAVLMLQTEYAIQICKDQPLLERLGDLLAGIREAGKKVRHLSHQLHASELDYIGLAPALESLCRDFSQRSKIRLSCACKSVPARLERRVLLSLYRVAQESLHNVTKHADAKSVSLELAVIGEEIVLSIKDDGKGFDSGTIRRDGLGLISMRERMNLVSGTFAVRSAPGLGTTIEARVPVDFVEKA